MKTKQLINLLVSQYLDYKKNTGVDPVKIVMSKKTFELLSLDTNTTSLNRKLSKLSKKGIKLRVQLSN